MKFKFFETEGSRQTNALIRGVERKIFTWMSDPAAGRYLEIGNSRSIVQLVLRKHMLPDPSRGGILNGVALAQITVGRAHRRKGIANKIIDFLKHSARETGLDFVLIEQVSSPAMEALVSRRTDFTALRGGPSYIWYA